MKKITRFLSGLSLAVFSIGAAIGVSIASNKDDVEKAEAATAKVLYVDLSLNSKFKESGANPYVRYWNGSQNYVALNHVANNIYVTASAIPAAVLTNSSYGFECYCFNQAEKGNDCTTTWIFGDGVLQYDNYNYLAVAPYVANQQNQIKGFGYYNATESNGGATPSTQRVWVINNNNEGFYGNDDWGSPCKNGLGYFDSSNNWHMVVMDAVKDSRDGNKYFYYADIPTTTTSYHLVRLSQGTNHNHLYYLDAYCDSITVGKIYYVGTYSYEDAKNLTESDDAGDASSNVLAKVLEAFYTCRTTGANGCTAENIANLKTTWFDRTTATDMGTVSFNDYANGDTSYSGTRSRSVTIQNKWTSMQSVSTGGKPSGLAVLDAKGNSLDSTVTLTLTTGVITLVAIGGFFFLKKKRIGL